MFSSIFWFFPAIVRVTRGAHFMDESDPGWAMKINPHIVDVWSKIKCPLGQRHGMFIDGVAHHRLTAAQIYSLGFIADDKKFSDALSRSWRRAALRRRRKADPNGVERGF